MNLLTEKRRHRSGRGRGNQLVARPRPVEGQRASRPRPVALREDLNRPDFAARRGRAAGGPKDHACYSCSCGFIFEADVSTSVACPHCGDTQAW